MANVYKIDDLIKFDFLKVPKSLFVNPTYKKMSSDAKLAYAQLYDLLSLSQKNGWINENGEVYLCFSRKMLAEELGICDKTATKIFKELVAVGLIMDVKMGQGRPNRIYIVKPEVSGEQAAEFLDDENARRENVTGQEPNNLPNQNRTFYGSRTEHFTGQEPNNLRFKNRTFYRSRTEHFTGQEPKDFPPNNTNINQIDYNQTENSQSVTDRQLLNDIFKKCELEYFDDDVRRIFTDAIERLFYCNTFKIGTSTLPRDSVRSRLCELDYSTLETALEKMHRNKKQIYNSTAYVMSVIFNCLTENDTETHIDPLLNSLRSGQT